MAKYELVDCCPVPAKLAPVLRQIKKETGCVYQSVYRGTDARALLEKCGKHDQAWLYAHLPRGVANPPGRSTHELRSDGAAYAGPIGRKLFYWQCGIDIDNAHVAAFIKAASKHGFTASITYPNSPVEYHHVNFRKEPILSIWQLRPLKRGDKGARVRKLTHRLAYIKDLRLKPYLAHDQDVFDLHVEDAVKRYQHDHKQKVDGVVGVQTWRALTHSVRYWKQRYAAK